MLLNGANVADHVVLVLGFGKSYVSIKDTKSEESGYRILCVAQSPLTSERNVSMEIVRNGWQDRGQRYSSMWCHAKHVLCSHNVAHTHFSLPCGAYCVAFIYKLQLMKKYEPPLGKNNNLHRRKQRRRSALQ